MLGAEANDSRYFAVPTWPGGIVAVTQSSSIGDQLHRLSYKYAFRCERIWKFISRYIRCKRRQIPNDQRLINHGNKYNLLNISNLQVTNGKLHNETDVILGINFTNYKSVDYPIWRKIVEFKCYD